MLCYVSLPEGNLNHKQLPVFVAKNLLIVDNPSMFVASNLPFWIILSEPAILLAWSGEWLPTGVEIPSGNLT